MLLGVFVCACTSTPTPTTATRVLFGIGGVFVIGVGSLVLGVVLMFVYSARPGLLPGRDAAPSGTPDLILAPPADQSRCGCPTREETVIAPDLSNLPPGREPMSHDTAGRLRFQAHRVIRTRGDQLLMATSSHDSTLEAGVEQCGREETPRQARTRSK